MLEEAAGSLEKRTNTRQYCDRKPELVQQMLGFPNLLEPPRSMY